MRGRTRAKPKKPLRLVQVEEVLALIPKSSRDLRDRAMLSVAYSAMLRRSELVALELGDIAFDADGSGTVTVKFSKTDQASEGHVRYLAPFAVGALQAWLGAVEIEEGCLFSRVLPSGAVAAAPLTDHEVARIFKRLALRVGGGGIDAGGIAGHSTRIGAAHDLVEPGFDVAAIANAGGRVEESSDAELLHARVAGE